MLAMQSTEKDGSRDRELVLKHQQSFSEAGRSVVPMWDSADPDRAPPPLPLNPGSNSPATRPNVSATVQAAAAALVEKSRENVPSSYTTNPMPLKSPEKSLIKGQYHKRMQSLQTPTNNRDPVSYLESRSPEKPNRTIAFEKESISREKSPHRTGTPTPSGKEAGREALSLRPSSRYLSKPILGESTPPSATMLALQNMQIPIEIESTINSSNAISTPRQAQGLESLSSQILSLTAIATGLQQEMAQLSRRSKDNATDLVSLKAATNARDEDIRKSLKELVESLSAKYTEPESSSRSLPYVHPGTGAFMIDSKAHDCSPSSRKSYTLPRIPSPGTFAAAMERELTASPGMISTDGSASIALLEKVLREMATKEGQEKLLRLLDEIKSRTSETHAENSMSKMLEEILNLVKESSGSRALVRSRNGANGNAVNDKVAHLELEFETPRSGALTRSPGVEVSQGNRHINSGNNKDRAASAANLVTEDILNILKRVKNSVAEGGGLTNEVKALVRELRGEVLGMGREIARKLEQAETSRAADSPSPPAPGKDEISQIVEGALTELKVHMERLIRESSSSSCSTLDRQDVYTAVKKALSEIPFPEPAAAQEGGSGLAKDEILETVREAWEAYKPEIELQNFGLERDEILECLTEGLKTYQAPRESLDPRLTYEQVLEAVQNGLQNFTPPPIVSETPVSREDIILTVRECLESFEWPDPPPLPEREPCINRDDVLDAVKEGLACHPGLSRELELSRGDLVEAVRAGLDETVGSLNSPMGEQVLEELHGLVDEMKSEFKQYSSANGRDTEQVLDAVKDGLEALRGEIESYVDRASDVTGKDEIIDTVKNGFTILQSDLEKCTADSTCKSSGGRTPDTIELLDVMEKEFEHLRQTMSTLLIRNGVSNDKDEILDAIRDIADDERSRYDNSEIAKMVKEEFEHLREALTLAIMRPSSSVDKDEIISALKESFESLQEENLRRRDGNESVVSNTSELLDAFQDGICVLRAEMEKVLNKPADISSNYEIIDTLKEGLAGVKAEIERFRESQKESEEINITRGREIMIANESSIGSGIDGLKALLIQLQIKVDAIETGPPTQENASSNHVKKDDLNDILDAIKEVQGLVVDVGSRETTPEESVAKKSDTDAIETLLLNIRAKIDELTVADTVKVEQVDTLETLLKETKDILEGFAAHMETEGSTKSDLAAVESIVKDIWIAVEDLKSNTESDEGSPEKVIKSDIQTLETLLFEVKTQLEELAFPDVDDLPTKDDIGALSILVTEFKEKMEMESDLTAQAFESRKIEHGGLAEKIEDAKLLLSEVRDQLKGRLAESEEGIADLKTILEDLSQSSESFAREESLKELTTLICAEFERSQAHRDSIKIEAEERDATMFTKQEETRDAVVLDLSKKIDEKFDKVMAKYDGAQLVAESNFAAAEERDLHSLETLASTKSLAEDLKLVIGGMGDSVAETCERMSDDAKTFFTRVDQSFSKMDSIHADVKAQNEHMKGEFEKAFAATSRLEGQMVDCHPQILNSLKEILSVVSQHYDHSQKSAEELKMDVSAIPSAIPPLLPAPPSPPSPRLTMEIPVPEKYDDSQVHDKLNVLLNHAAVAGKAFAQMDKLDQIHQQVTDTAREVSDMMTAQSRMIMEDYDSKRKELQENAIALEKRLAQKEKVEAEVLELKAEKETVLFAVQALRQERDDLSKQNMKLTKEISGLETALQLRREEMQLMEDRAEGLERRIVDDVLDYARSLLRSQPTAAQRMNLKRVPSPTTTVTQGSVGGTAKDGRILRTGVAMALKHRIPVRPIAGPAMSSRKERRILSLNHVAGNRGASDKQMILPPGSGGAFANLKRSHSVKTNYPLRKASWETRSLVANKENEIFKEEDGVNSDYESETGTERRTSYSGTYTDSMCYGTGSTLSVSTDQKTSHCSSTDGLVAAEPGSWVEDSDDEDIQDDGREQAGHLEAQSHENRVLKGLDAVGGMGLARAGELAIYGQHSDSGLGTDLPSTASEKGFRIDNASLAGD